MQIYGLKAAVTKVMTRDDGAKVVKVIKRRPEVYVSSGAFHAHKLQDLFDAARLWAVQNIELTGGLERKADITALLAGTSDLNFLVHNYFPTPPKPFVLNLGSDDPETLELSRSHCRAAVDLSHALGAQWYSVHAGFAASVRPEHLGRKIPAENRTDKCRAAEIFESSIRDLVSYAAPRGVGILVENNVVSASNLVDGRNEMLLLATAEELVDFARRMDREYFGLLIDFGHVNVTAATLGLDREAFLAEVAPFTRALHLSENDGLADSNLPFDRSSWISAGLAVFDPDYIVVESYRITRSELAACIDAIEVAHG